MYPTLDWTIPWIWRIVLGCCHEHVVVGVCVTHPRGVCLHEQYSPVMSDPYSHRLPVVHNFHIHHQYLSQVPPVPSTGCVSFPLSCFPVRSFTVKIEKKKCGFPFFVTPSKVKKSHSHDQKFERLESRHDDKSWLSTYGHDLSHD